MERCAGRGYIGRRGANLRVAVQRLGKLLRDHRLLRRGADGFAIRGGRPRRRGALDRPGGGRLRHAHGHPLLRRAARVGDPERAVARGLAGRARAGRRGCGGHRVHGGRHPAGAEADEVRAGAGRLAVALRLSARRLCDAAGGGARAVARSPPLALGHWRDGVVPAVHRHSQRLGCRHLHRHAAAAARRERAGPDEGSLASQTASGGTLPISLTAHGSLLYVLNAGGAGNISGFSVGATGALAPIAGSTQPLSGTNVGPAQVSFSPDGRRLVVTEKNTNLLDVYAVDANGAASGRASVASAGGTPFGFAFGHRNDVFVSEATGSASSYVLDAGNLSLVSGAVLTHRGAPCWAVVTDDGRFGYTGNGSGSVSAFAITPSGAISLVDTDGATAVVSGGVNDIALSGNSRYLYVLGTGATPAIYAFRLEADGHLNPLGPVGELPAGTRGLAAR